jgi:hypothetical protein
MEFRNQPLRSIIVRAWGWSPAVLASVLVVLVCLKAIMAVDLVWDSLSYHLPFSALRVGLMTDWQFQRPPPDQDTLKGYYLGSPILADLLRGWLWKLSGRPEAVNLLGVISLLALIGYLKWAFRLEVAWVLIGVLAIPAVQTSAAGNYVDLPANAAFTVLLFSIVELWSAPEKFRRPARWVVLFFAAFAAANIKLQTGVFVCLSLPFVVPPAWRLLRERNARWPAITGMALLGFGGSLLIAVNFIKNLILYRNPFFPIDTKIAGIHFVGTLLHGDWAMRGDTYKNVSQPILWILSVLEFHSLDGRGIPYMNGMGDVPATALSAYMGGFFSTLAVATICFLFLGVIRRRDRLSAILPFIFVTSGIVVSVFPNSENLRYETFWMMFSIIGCLLLLRSPPLKPYLQSYKIVLIASLVFVTSVTGGIYFTPIWNPMQEYVDRSGAEKLLEAIVKPGDVICLKQGPGEWDNRFAIMFAPIFHQKLAKERPYAIREGFCDGYKTIPRGKFY